MTGITLGLGLLSLVRWARRGFWVPPYVHVLALMFFLLGGLLTVTAWQWQALTWELAVLFLLVGPLLVYVWFAYFGGVEEAVARDTQSRCRSENNP